MRRNAKKSIASLRYIRMLLTITTAQLTHVCVHWCVKIVRAACTINTHTVRCICIESKMLYLAAYIPTLSYQGYYFLDSA